MYLMGSTKKLIFYSLLLITLIFFLADRIYIGREIDNYKGVPIFYNGILMFDSHGKNYSKDGYYYGQKWQCVEFIKRFFYDIYGHAMPNVRGHAASLAMLLLFLKFSMSTWKLCNKTNSFPAENL